MYVSAMAIASTDPTTGEVWQRFAVESQASIERKLDIAVESFALWSTTGFVERAALLRRVAELLDAEREACAQLMTREMGKTIRAARAEAEKCAATCRYYADESERLLSVESIQGESQRVQFDPLGPILAVMPWNFLFWQVVRFAAPAILAGNVALLKHASNVPSCALKLEELFRRAGAPEGVFQALLVGSDVVSSIIADRRVTAVTLTGSEAAGRAVGAAAGQALKPSVLELGGSDPFIVLASATLTRAIDAAVTARTLNNGQSCIAAKRFIVVDELYEQFMQVFVAKMGALRVGNPALETTDLGPLATRAMRDEVAQQVAALVAAGARVHLGGLIPPGPGNFYPATVLDSISTSAVSARDEVFGPVALVFRARDASHALELANDSDFGLGASVWTEDREQAREFARSLEVGSVFVNSIVASDPRFPFGGIKRSGYGRELGGYGLREFVNIKTVRCLFDATS